MQLNSNPLTTSEVLFVQTADKTISNTVTETSIVGTGVGNLVTTMTLPANYLISGKTLRIKAGGVYSTPAIVSSSVLINIKIGGTVIATVTTTALLTSASNLKYEGELLITCRSTGQTGSVITHGDIEYAIGLAGQVAIDSLNNNGNTTTIDTTIDNLIDITIQWDSATTTRILKNITFLMERLN